MRSRGGALSDGVVATSDAVVTIASILALAFAGARRARSTCGGCAWPATRRRRQPSRRRTAGDWQVLVYLLVPGLNLAMAGVILAELEHHVLHRAPDDRPEPDPRDDDLWSAWVVSGLLFTRRSSGATATASRPRRTASS